MTMCRSVGYQRCHAVTVTVLPFCSADPACNFAFALFEIREPDAVPSDEETLHRMYQGITRAREQELLAGTGRVAEPGAREFRVVILFRDCLLHRSMRLGQCIVAPGPGMTPDTEDQLLGLIMRELGLEPAPLSPHEQELRRRPTVTMAFPRVLAQDVDDALHIATTEAQKIADVLALHRGAYPTVIGGVAQALGAPDDGKWFIPEPGYRGNLAGGFISGEDPRSIMRDVRRLGG